MRILLLMANAIEHQSRLIKGLRETPNRVLNTTVLNQHGTCLRLVAIRLLL